MVPMHPPRRGTVCIFRAKLQLGIAVAVDQSVQTAAFLAEGAVVVVVALIIGQIAGGIDGADLDGLIFQLVHGPVDAGDADHLAAVIFGACDAALGGIAGGDAGHQDQNLLVPDVGLNIVTEDHLVEGVVLRLHHTDLVGIADGVASGGQGLGQARAHQSHAVHAQDGIDLGICKILSQLRRDGLGVSQADLLVGDVDVVIDVAVVGCEVASGDPERNVASADRELHSLKHCVYLQFSQIKKRADHITREMRHPGEGKNAFFHCIKGKQFLQEKRCRPEAKESTVNLWNLHNLIQ